MKQKIGLMPYINRYRFGVSGYILTSFIGGIFSVLSTIFVANAIEQLTLGNFNSSLNYLALMLIITLLKRLIWWISAIFYDVYSTKIMADLNTDLAKQSFKLNSASFASHDTGTFVQRIVTDPEDIIDKLARMIDLITDVLTSIGAIIYIGFLNIYISLSIILVLVGAFVIQYFNMKNRKKLKEKVRYASDNITSLTTEIVRSEKDIKSLALEEQLSKVSARRYSEYKKARYKLESTTTKFAMGRIFWIEVLGILTLALGIIMVNKALLTIAAFMLVYSYQSGINSFIWALSDIMSSIVDIKVGTKRMFALFDENEFVVEKFGNISLQNIKGNIEFKNVSFSFKEYSFIDKKKTLKSENKIFDNLSFVIPSNSTVAFVGKSGSGKSTILNLMCKMIEADSGEILLDGTNITSLNKKTLRNCFSLVNQSPYIFDMTIKENLLLAYENSTDEDIIDALKKASLYEFVSSLPEGINSRVGESGIKLSGGQKQRLAIARAFLKKSNVILFDESTSSLDNFSQEEVKKSISSIKGKSTIIIVAHRLSTIKDADIIFFLDEGKIIDTGSFEELISSNEKFNRMFLAENINNF